MKHEKWTTAVLIVYLLFGLVLTIFFLGPASLAKQSSELPVTGPVFALLLLGIVGVSTFAWMKMLKKVHPSMIAGVLSVAVASLCVELVQYVFPLHRFVQGIVFLWLYGYLVGAWLLYDSVQDKDERTKRTIHTILWSITNVLVVCAMITAGLRVGNIIPWQFALGIAVIIGCYDAWAVWKSRHMVSLAKGFLKARFFPGVWIKGRRDAILGGGDLFMLAFVPAALSQVSMKLAATAAGGLAAGLVYIFLFSNPKKFYPAIPYMLFGGVLSVFVFKALMLL